MKRQGWIVPRNRFSGRLLGGFSLLVLIAAFAACAQRKAAQKKHPFPPQEAVVDGALEHDSEALLTPRVDVAEASIRGKKFEADPALEVAHFGYDRYFLSEQARAVLRRNAEHLKHQPDAEVLIEGHCDERGTLEYNLALGQRRAKAVREYYIRLGIPGDSIATISYGEERPACGERTETCWAKNRRAATKTRRSEPQSTAEGVGNP